MTPATPSWAVVATIKADDDDILRFVAWYLDLGATHIYLYFDEDRPRARTLLAPQDRVSVTVTDEAYWSRRGRRPEMHQRRQSQNASRTYRRQLSADWLLHCDVDEFLWPGRPIPEVLAALPDTVRSARVRPIEAMATHSDVPPPPGHIWFKGCNRRRADRIRETERLYPTYGRHLKGGFLSHVEGKLFVRRGIAGAQLRIHNLMMDGKPDPASAELDDMRLCHLHAPDSARWFAHLDFRTSRGAYGPGRKPDPHPAGDAMNLHDLLSWIVKHEGRAGLAQFYGEVCTNHPELSAALDEMGYLYAIDLQLDARKARYFPDP